MKIVKNLCIILLITHAISSTTLCAESSTGWFHKLSYVYSKISSTCASGIQRIRNIQWTTPAITKAVLLTAVTATAMYGITKSLSKLRYYFGKEPPHPDTPPAPTTQPRIEIQPEAAVQQEPEQPHTLAQEDSSSNAAIATQPQQEIEPAALQAQPEPEVQLSAVPYFDDPAHHVIEPIRFQNAKGEQITVQQLGVFDQYTEDVTGHTIGGGNNSCGYHAGPKNIPALTGLIQGIAPQEDFVRLLRDGAVTRELFNHTERQQGALGTTKGHLRNIIIFYRLKTVLIQYYSPKIQVTEPQSSPDTYNPRIFLPYYNRLKTSFLNHVVSELLDKQSRKEITLELIIQWIAQAPIDIADNTLTQLGCTQEQFLDFLRDKVRIAQYIRLAEPYTISCGDIDSALTAYNTAHPTARIDPQGDWLNEDEIKLLLRFQQMQHNSIGRALDHTHVETTVLEGATPGLFVIMKNISQLRDHIAAGTLPQQKLQAFVLGNTDQRAENAGHWITMVLECAHRRRRYTITNSAYNRISMFSHSTQISPAIELIRYLEGDEVAHQLQPSPQFQQQITTNLHQYIEQSKSSCRCPAVQKKLEDTLNLFHEFVGDYSSFGGQQAFEQQVQEALIN